MTIGRYDPTELESPPGKERQAIHRRKMQEIELHRRIGELEAGIARIVDHQQDGAKLLRDYRKQVRDIRRQLNRIHKRKS